MDETPGGISGMEAEIESVENELAIFSSIDTLFRRVVGADAYGKCASPS